MQNTEKQVKRNKRKVYLCVCVANMLAPNMPAFMILANSPSGVQTLA